MADQKTTVAHTPGPWRVESDPSHFGTRTTVVGGGQGDRFLPRELIVQVGGFAGPLDAEANARMIAAAPEMAAAARNALEVFLTVRMYFGDGSLGRAEIDDSIGQIKAALAKAGGQAQ